MELNELPIVNICGDRGRERTATIRQLVQLFAKQGVTVRVLTGTDDISARTLFAAARTVDLLLIEEASYYSLPTVYLAGEDSVSSEMGTLATLGRGAGRVAALAEVIGAFMTRQWAAPSVVGCLLIGGKSSRMGHPKHLIRQDGRSWMQRTAEVLGLVTDRVVVAGQGELEDCPLQRLRDVPGCSGPLAGILAAMRAFPWSTVLVCACDMPDITRNALEWLLQQRRPGQWAVIPKVAGHVEPLLALYDFRIFAAAEAMAERRMWRMSTLAEADGAQIVAPPEPLTGAWRNVNTPEQLVSGGGT